MARRWIARAVIAAALLASTPGCLTDAAYRHLTRTARAVDFPAEIRGAIVAIDGVSVVESDADSISLFVRASCDDGKSRIYSSTNEAPFSLAEVATLPSSTFAVLVTRESELRPEWSSKACTVEPDGAICDSSRPFTEKELEHSPIVRFGRGPQGEWVIEVEIPPRQGRIIAVKAGKPTSAVIQQDRIVRGRLVSPTSDPGSSGTVMETSIGGTIVFVLLAPFTVALDVALLPVTVPLCLFVIAELGAAFTH